jgi:hypothetical protein
MKITERTFTKKYDGFTPFHIECRRGVIAGSFQHKENRICISNCFCKNCLKELIDYAVKKFKTDKILFYNILNPILFEILKGFKRIIIIDPIFDEEVVCLEGRWKS